MVRLAGMSLFWLTLAAAVFVTAAGMAAPGIPRTEFFNQFRPFWLAGSFTLTALAALLAAPRAGVVVAVGVLLANLGRTAAPRFGRQAPANARTSGS